MSSERTRKVVVAGVLGAISALLGWTRLGFIPWFSGASLTIMHVPAIIGAVLEGPWVGAAIGLIFGGFSMLQAAIAPNGPTDVWFTNPILAILAATGDRSGGLAGSPTTAAVACTVADRSRRGRKCDQHCPGSGCDWCAWPLAMGGSAPHCAGEWATRGGGISGHHTGGCCRAWRQIRSASVRAPDCDVNPGG